MQLAVPDTQGLDILRCLPLKARSEEFAKTILDGSVQFSRFDWTREGTSRDSEKCISGGGE